MGSAKKLMTTGVMDLFSGDQPDLPKIPDVEAPVSAGEEGVRSGEMARAKRRRTVGQLMLTRGQQRGTGDTLSGMRQKLG